MTNGLVKLQGNDLLVGTWDLSIGFDVRHARLKDLIVENKHRLEKYGPIKKVDIFHEEIESIQRISNAPNNEKNEGIHDQKLVMNRTKKLKKKGGQVEQFLINQDQYICLLTILPNSEKCLDFKFRLADEFIRMRKVLIKLMIQKENDNWLEKRAQGIVERRVETDAIKDFIEYAKHQGSKSADKYYMVISKMENQSILNIELLNQNHENLREVVDGFDLDSLKMCDRIVAQTIRIGMNYNKYYKDIFKECKEKVEGFALAIGKTPLRLLK